MIFVTNVITTFIVQICYDIFENTILNWENYFKMVFDINTVLFSLIMSFRATFTVCISIVYNFLLINLVTFVSYVTITFMEF